jgi:predicted transposase YbfD/YdcC
MSLGETWDDEMEDTAGVAVVFGGLEDPRIERLKLYPLREILFLALVAVMAGVRSWRGAETFGEDRLDWLRKFMPFNEGIPSHQTIGRVFSLLKPSTMEVAFTQFMMTMTGKPADQIVALDGKTLRRSFDKASSQKPLHILNAVATENGLTLGQRLVDCKTNEITAVPELLDILNLKAATITADALNTQKAIAEKIVSQGNDYLLPAKGNQKALLEEIQREFITSEFDNTSKMNKQVVEKDHGRIDTRTYFVLPAQNLDASQNWKGLKSIGMAITESERAGKVTKEVRYYIASFLPDVERFAKAARGHWAIENGLHWTLDVTFREDESRVRKDHAPTNFSLIRKLALNLLRADKTVRKSIPQKMIKASVNPAYHEMLLRVEGFK